MVKLVVVKGPDGTRGMPAFKATLLVDRESLGKLLDSASDLFNEEAESVTLHGVEMNIDGESEDGSLVMELLDE